MTAGCPTASTRRSRSEPVLDRIWRVACVAAVGWLLSCAGSRPVVFVRWHGRPPRSIASARRDGPDAGQALATWAVDELLEAIRGTDRGVSTTAEQKEEVFRLIEQLEAVGEGQDYLSDGSLFGRYEVAYVGAPSSRIANPAGGRWRGGLGRLLCPTRGLYQHILRPEEGASDGDGDGMAVNLLEVALLGLLPVAVVLHGPAKRLTPQERESVASERSTPGGLSANAVRAKFEAPRLALGSRGRGLLGLARFLPPLRLRAGPRTSVVLDASYVDDRIRIGKGASGIRFVFLRAEDDPDADAWKRVLAGPALGSKGLGASLMGVGALGVARSGMVAARGVGSMAAAMGPWALVAMLGLLCLCSSGGIVRGQPRNADYPGQGMSPVDD